MTSTPDLLRRLADLLHACERTQPHQRLDLEQQRCRGLAEDIDHLNGLLIDSSYDALLHPVWRAAMGLEDAKSSLDVALMAVEDEFEATQPGQYAGAWQDWSGSTTAEYDRWDAQRDEGIAAAMVEWRGTMSRLLRAIEGVLVAVPQRVAA